MWSLKDHKLILITVILIASSVSTVYAAQTVTDRVEIDNDNIAAAINAGDLFGYQIEAIGDLDSDGVIDLATIKFSDDSNEANVGSVLILFMNNDGSVKSTNEIVMDGTAAGLNGCIANDSTNRDNGSLEQLAFVGDLDGDGEPTLALGANSNDHPIANSGAVYMLELNSDGTVDNCVLITEDSNGFDPGAGVYRQSGEGQAANFGWPVIATDLNGDGQNELIVGATSNDDNYTDLWVLFLTTTGAVSSHPATPISGNTDIGMDSSEYISDGKSISGTKIMVTNENDGDGGGSVFIVNLSSAGAYVSSTEILGSSIAGVANDERFGSGVTPLGDLDGDNIIDILVGNEAGDDTNSLSGEVHILYLNNDDTVKESQKISNESENTRTGETPFAASDLFGHGMVLWKTDGGIATIAISATQDDTGSEANSGAIHLLYVVDANKSGTGLLGDGQPPTMGLAPNGNRVVQGGFTYNGQTVDVLGGHTPFPLITAIVGEENKVTVKIYESTGINGLRLVQFVLGLQAVGDPIDQAEVIIAIWIQYGGSEITEIKITDVNGLIDRDSIKVETEMVNCRTDANTQCAAITLYHTFLEAPIHHVMSVMVMDIYRYSVTNSFNHGIMVVGESLNPPDIAYAHIPSPHYPQERGLIELTNTDRGEKLWIDQYGFVWHGDDSKMVLISEIPLYLDDDPKSPFSGYNNRINSHFGEYKQEQLDKAITVFDSSLIQNELGDTFAHTYPEVVDRLVSLADEMKAAEMRIIQAFEIKYPGVDRGLESFDEES